MATAILEELVAGHAASMASLRYDRKIKQRLYASAGIPTFWIVNLGERVIEVYLQPDPTTGTYVNRTEFRFGQSTPLTVGGQELNVDVAAVLA